MTVMRDDLDNTRIIGIGVIGTFIVAALVFALYALFLKMDADQETARYATPMKLRDYRSDQATRLGEYGLIDRDKRTVKIPIERAMELTVRDMAAAPASK